MHTMCGKSDKLLLQFKENMRKFIEKKNWIYHQKVILLRMLEGMILDCDMLRIYVGRKGKEATKSINEIETRILYRLVISNPFHFRPTLKWGWEWNDKLQIIHNIYRICNILYIPFDVVNKYINHNLNEFCTLLSTPYLLSYSSYGL